MEDFKVEANQSEVKGKNISELLELLKKSGAIISADSYTRDAYIIQFNFEEGNSKTTLRILFNDRTGSDVVITNMTSLPETRKGFGSNAIKILLEWARANNLNEVRATQVQSEIEEFWTKNGFTKDKEPNSCNDFIYRL